ncbi:MAG TPA: glutaminyl-peptide cyclotransferase [Thermoanaerobaculia bacterium]|nr:glutaminyl-peptide cyclotransferase [Thermoanaerobaculia bacterium]
MAVKGAKADDKGSGGEKTRKGWIILAIMVTLLLAAALAWSLRSAAPPAAPSAAPAVAPSVPKPPELLKVKVLAARHHDPAAFTQGLLVHGGSLYESTGMYGTSSLREVDPLTGAVKRKVDVPSELFAEGLALVDDRLIQLTWKEQKARVYKLADFALVDELRYEGEGWGLCWDGKRLVMTDGSDKLTFRDPKTMAFLGEVRVTRADRMGEQMLNLNELECVDGLVYANVWQTDQILRIDPKDGRVTAVIDASGLLTPEERQRTDVLNGIAWDPQRKLFLITGKLWPKLFEVEFVPAGSPGNP